MINILITNQKNFFHFAYYSYRGFYGMYQETYLLSKKRERERKIRKKEGNKMYRPRNSSRRMNVGKCTWIGFFQLSVCDLVGSIFRKTLSLLAYLLTNPPLWLCYTNTIAGLGTISAFQRYVGRDVSDRVYIRKSTYFNVKPFVISMYDHKLVNKRWLINIKWDRGYNRYVMYNTIWYDITYRISWGIEITKYSSQKSKAVK
jgi:hypothetical protein